MSFTPKVFISATSTDLGSVRQIVKKALVKIGCLPVEQTDFPPDARTVAEMLRAKIGECHALIHIVGLRFGSAPSGSDDQPRRSYTQMEYDIAREMQSKRGDKHFRVYTFICPDDFPFDPSGNTESKEQSDLQQAHRAKLLGMEHIYGHPDNPDELKEQVLILQETVHALRFTSERNIRRVFLAATAILMALCGIAWALFFILNDPARLHAAWMSDDFTSVRISQTATGTVLGDEPYQIKLELKNPTSMQMIVTRMVVVSNNNLVSKVFGSPDGRVFTSNNHVMYHLDGGETKLIPISLNEVLPREIEVAIYHNLAGTPSKFTLDLHARELPMPSPRYLPREKIFSGSDSLAAIRHGIEEARKWSSDSRLVAVFSTDSSIFIDPDSRLKYIVVKSWWTTFYSRKLNRDFVVGNDSGEAKAHKIDNPTQRKDVPSTDPDLPVIGFEQALDIANRASLLSADWKDARLGVIDINGKSHCVWFLPYRAPNGLPVIIDAVSSEQVVLDGKTNFTLRQISTASIQSK